MFVAFNVVLSSFQRTSIKKDLCLAKSANSYATLNFSAEMQAFHVVIFKCQSSWIAFSLFHKPSKLNAKRQLIDPRSIFRNYP